MSSRYNKLIIMASWCSPSSIWNQMVLPFPIQETTVHLIHNGQPCVSSHCFKFVPLLMERFPSSDQDPITRSEQLPYQAFITAFLRTSLFLGTFQGSRSFPRKQSLHHIHERIQSIRYQTGKLNVIKRQKISFLGLQVLRTGLWTKDIQNSR